MLCQSTLAEYRDGALSPSRFGVWTSLVLPIKDFTMNMRRWLNPTTGDCTEQVNATDSDSDSDSDKVYSTKIYTSTISGLHEFLRNTNNNIVLIYK